MGEYAELAMEGHYRIYGEETIFPRGWMSQRRPCPYCQKPVAGRDEGMRAHIKAKHGVAALKATDWSALPPLDEISRRLAATAEAPNAAFEARGGKAQGNV
ncbi:hypothetical protein [Novosphingobium sp. MMS21-SN21R]|uniref:hypothetical protein n=1 Tax=Novosphingobium sp. MMS21-SN21R TaxID=2969298 RepID=UPI0028840662|nr:hypothetical protein [Novosphingobium sp. MMS21-SN21R]MDT0507505.1 hypothetical protein [Novosphingobium sp. MMS21-SN21R]